MELYNRHNCDNVNLTPLGDSGANAEWKLPDTVFPNGLTGQEAREACRALKGSPLRIEIYALDGSDKEAIPYTVEEKSYHLQCLQRKGENRHAVFLKTGGETLAYHYERDIAAPRIIHSLILETDAYGNPTKQAQVAYPKRDADSNTPAEQKTMLVTYTETDFINATYNASLLALLPPSPSGLPPKGEEKGIAFYGEGANSDRHSERSLSGVVESLAQEQENFNLIGIPYQSKQYQIHNLTPPQNAKWEADILLNMIENATPIDYAATIPASGIQKRSIAHTRNYFWDEELDAILPLGEIAAHALPHHSETLELTQALIDFLNSDGTKITAAMLSTDCKYKQENNLWYATSEIQFFDADSFYMPSKTQDPFGNETVITYDNYRLFPVKITDALGFETNAEYNYRVLQPFKLTDPNGNTQSIAFDTLGMVVKLAIAGKNNEGDTLNDPTEIYEYDLHAWADEQKPVFAHVSKRETHADINTHWLETYVYTDGLGNEIMAKANVADGLAWTIVDAVPTQIQSTDRWLASGKTILNNKGLAVRQYEPWFSDNPDYEFDDRLSMYGVTPVMHYDPLGRLIQTDLPDGTITKIEFDIWQQKNYDQNDCDVNSPHYNTPQIIDMDVLGRPYQTTDLLTPTVIARNEAISNPDRHSERSDSGVVESPTQEHENNITQSNTEDIQRTTEQSTVIPNGASAEWWNLLQNRDENPNLVTTHNKLDITGRILTVIDALNREATQNRFGLSEQNQVYVENIDSGKRWMLTDTAGKPIRRWDERGHEFTFTYDELQRLTETNVNNICVERIEYGTEFEINSIGEIRHIYAQDGITSFEYDFKGNITKQTKQFAQDYQNELDWNANPALINEVFTTETSYDALNRPVSLTNPDNKTTFYTYDKGGLLITVQVDTNSPYIDNIEYNEKQQRLAVYYGNNTKTKYEYNPLNFRLTRILTTRNTGNDALQDLNYSYDAVGNIIQQTDNAQQTFYFNNAVIAPTGMYEYDALYRLIKAEGRELSSLTAPNQDDFANNIPCPNPAGNAMQNYVHNYQYDKLGNILQDAWKSYQYATANNYLLGHNNLTNQYTYDAHGNMLTMPHLNSLAWDYLDQLHSATNGTFTSFYNYDSEGNRSRKVVIKGNIREERYYIGGYEIYRKYIGQTLNFERETLNLSDDEKVFVRIETKTNENPVVRYQYDNHLGSACLELDVTGQIISYEEYHPFGTTSYRSGRSETEVSLKRYKYNGKERDEETGLYMYGMRYYAAWICRFISVDSLQFKYPELTPFQYASNRPITGIDMDGLEFVNSSIRNQKNNSLFNTNEVEKAGIGLGIQQLTGIIPSELEVNMIFQSRQSTGKFQLQKPEIDLSKVANFSLQDSLKFPNKQEPKNNENNKVYYSLKSKRNWEDHFRDFLFDIGAGDFEKKALKLIEKPATIFAQAITNMLPVTTIANAYTMITKQETVWGEDANLLDVISLGFSFKSFKSLFQTGTKAKDFIPTGIDIFNSTLKEIFKNDSLKDSTETKQPIFIEEKNE